MFKKIKILHIQETIGSGGVERIKLSLAKHLDKERFDQRFVCTFAIGNVPCEIRGEGFEVIPIGQVKSPFHLSQHRKVQKIIDDFKPDIIHGAVFEGVTMAAINGWVKRVPAIVIEETSDPQNRTWKGHLLMRLFSRLADKVIGVSEGVTNEYLRKKLHISSSKVVLINNGVSTPRQVSERELETARKQWGIHDQDFIIGSTGRMLHDSHKRFSDLIRAFAEFSNQRQNIKLLLVGDGREKEEYIKLVGELGITERVIFTGYQSDVTLFYKMMNIFCLVSAREAFGLVLAEAMLNKLPVIATRVGGIKYIVEDNRTGFLVEPLQIDQIVTKLEKLYLSNDLRREMGENGFRKAMQEYTEENYVCQIEKLYTHLASPDSK